jgi:hypothetical protein
MFAPVVRETQRVLALKNADEIATLVALSLCIGYLFRRHGTRHGTRIGWHPVGLGWATVRKAPRRGGTVPPGHGIALSLRASPDGRRLQVGTYLGTWHLVSHLVSGNRSLKYRTAFFEVQMPVYSCEAPVAQCR